MKTSLHVAAKDILKASTNGAFTSVNGAKDEHPPAQGSNPFPWQQYQQHLIEQYRQNLRALQQNITSAIESKTEKPLDLSTETESTAAKQHVVHKPKPTRPQQNSAEMFSIKSLISPTPSSSSNTSMTSSLTSQRSFLPQHVQPGLPGYHGLLGLRPPLTNLTNPSPGVLDPSLEMYTRLLLTASAERRHHPGSYFPQNANNFGPPAVSPFMFMVPGGNSALVRHSNPLLGHPIISNESPGNRRSNR